MFSPPPARFAAAIFALGLALSCSVARAGENISPLGTPPDWPSFEKFQETITHAEFTRLLHGVYAPRAANPELIRVQPEAAQFRIDRDADSWFTLRFAKDEASQKPFERVWRAAVELPKAEPGQELAGLKIALDPGHIGGAWARMEERWFQVGDSRPVTEGDMTLLVARLLAPRLRELGATVSLVREKAAPTTSKRPADLKEVSRKILLRTGNPEPRPDYDGPADPQKEQTVRWQNERLFYRNSEIRERAQLVNTKIKPDVVLCLHFNAEAWNDPAKPTLTDRNHFHMLINGSYLADELEYDDVRFEMLHRLLSRRHGEELPLAEKFAETLARRTKLPPYVYTTENVVRVGTTGYTYARNLIATRLFDAPVIYFEPYVMNSDEVFWRIQEGDYEGIRNVNGTDRPSIFREYADGVVDGLVEYYRETRK
ncbi:hypothetical protein BH20VER2_BH20VER2_04000 [soil metagenome]